MTQTHLRREGGRTWLSGIPRLGWGRNRDCTYAGALESALSRSGWPMDYDSIMGYSGLAFRIRWYHGDTGPRWCMSSPVGEFPDEVAATRRSTGWSLLLECRIDRKNPHMEEFGPKILAEIDAGRPVLTYDQQLNMAVIFGYAGEGQRLLLRTYADPDAETEVSVERIGPMVCFLGECDRPLSPKDALLEGIRIGVENWHRGSEPAPNGRYWHGHAAYLKWREDLHHAVNLSEEEIGQLHMVSAWVFASLRDARGAAVRFLRANADLLEGSRRRHLEGATDVLAEEVAFLRAVTTEAREFQGPAAGASARDWTEETRKREIGVLDRVLGLESRAIGELENLLDAAEVHAVAVH